MEELKQEKISVVMTVYDEPMWMLVQAVESILNQTYRDIEFVVVVDDPDHSQALDYLGSLKDIRLLVNEKNLGLPASLNKGIQIAAGRIIARMDADDISMEDRIEKEYQYMKSKGLDLVSTDRFLMNEAGEVWTDRFKVPKSSKYLRLRLRYSNCMVHPTFMFKKTLFDKVGGYKEEFVAAQDYAFVIDVVRAGGRIGCMDEKLLKYRIRTDGISNKQNYLQSYIAFYYSQVYQNIRVYHAEDIRKAVEGSSKEFREFKKQRQVLERCKQFEGAKKYLLQSYCCCRYPFIRKQACNSFGNTVLQGIEGINERIFT